MIYLYGVLIYIMVYMIVYDIYDNNTNSFNAFLFSFFFCGIFIDSTEDSWQPSDPSPLSFVPVISLTNIADSALC